jgi:catechol 2,3-dioxygenase-like lactoylglutathione lyase family enzyme
VTSPPELFRLALPVTDIEKAVERYERVLAMDTDRVGEGRAYFPCEGAIFVCVDPDVEGHGPAGDSYTGTVYFAVSDLDDCFARVRDNGFEAIDEPSVRAWGERSFYARDPFGNALCFVESSTRYTGSGRKATAKK